MKNRSPHPRAENLRRARTILSGAQRVVVLTGAGISAESGIPTFRGEEGLWRRYRPEDLATPDAFARDPRLVWEWYTWRREKIRRCRPNAAHLALARWSVGSPGRRIVTQNVDGLHRRALLEILDGAPVTAAAEPIELHGSIFRTRCVTCHHRSSEEERLDPTPRGSVPRCTRCGDVVRPDVVWFGEPLDERVIGEAFTLARSAEACLVVGTSAVVHPAASVASMAASQGASLVEINLEPTPLTGLSTVSIFEAAASSVPSVLKI